MPRQQPAISKPLDDQDDWLGEPEELPPRPRRRLLAAGGNPAVLALLGVLLIACGFIGGVLVEKGEASPSSPAGSPAASVVSRLRALRGAGAGASPGSTSTGASSSAGGFARPTAGTVAYLAGATLYVTDAEGNTVKVTTSPATSVTKTVKASVGAIHPGETVTITGETRTGGVLSAESIGVGSSGGLAALFDGSSARKRGNSGEPQLFGSG